ncbi:MAG: hypothetical protein K2J65_01420 [Duncaniella sp.]|nr:hypothetical protein [Duncaniella sp.]
MGLKSILKKNKVIVQIVKSYRKYRLLTPKINLWKTIYLNFKTQKFSDAIKFPILVYGKLTISCLTGKISLLGPITCGRFKIGYNSDKFSAQKGGALLNLTGEIISHGYFSCSIDCLIEVSGILELETCSFFGNMSKIRCHEYIYFGKGSRIVSECQAFDTNFHYMRNIYTGEVHKRTGKIIVGDYCWIGNRSSLMKGTILPNYSIVASNSLCNKNYTVDSPEYPLIGGVPAKIIGKGGYVRIFDIIDEANISKYFSENPDMEVYNGVIGKPNNIDDELKHAFENL